MTCAKQSYATKAKAEKTRTALWGKGRIGQHVYPCHRGGGTHFHIGHKKFLWLPGMHR